MRILVAEDERITRVALKRQLEQWGHTVTATEDGEQAWERFLEADFDIVVTDWEMPRLSGLELVRRIRESASAAYVYVIMLTGRTEKSDVVGGIEAGADDFVAKPFDREELRVRLLAGARIVNLERSLTRQNAELRDANERIRDGLRAAARVQRAMLPQHDVETPRVRTAWQYVPTEELAGDAVGLYLLDDRHLVSYVIDVSGHGVPAALLAVTAMYAMEPNSGVGSLLDGTGDVDGRGPGQVATELNRRFRAGESDGRFLTMILSVLDTHTGRLSFACAGHPPPLILRGTRQIVSPDTAGVPIAILDDIEYEAAVMHLDRGDRVYLFSDGLLEQREASSREQFGAGRLLALLSQHRETPVGEVLRHAVDTLAGWAGSTGFTDDVSLVAFEWLGG